MKSVQYGVFSGPYLPVLGLNTGKYGPKTTPYLDNFHEVTTFAKRSLFNVLLGHINAFACTELATLKEDNFAVSQF